MKNILIASLLGFISQTSLAQSNGRLNSDNTAPDRNQFQSASDYSEAKEIWANENEAAVDNQAVELEAIILEGEEAEKAFVHPNNEPSKILGRKENQGINPEIEMPIPE